MATSSQVVRPGGGESALVANGITVRFGGLTALSNVSLDVGPASIAGLVGPNGAGKSTLLAVLSGLLRPNDGYVGLRGEDVTNASAQSRASRGLARTFQQPELFMGLSVREHLVLAYRARVAHAIACGGTCSILAPFPPSAAENERIDGLLDILKLTGVADAPVPAPASGCPPSG